MTTRYVCTNLVGNVCVQWEELNTPLSPMAVLSQLTITDVWQIFSATALLFAVAWVFNQLPQFIKRF